METNHFSTGVQSRVTQRLLLRLLLRWP